MADSHAMILDGRKDTASELRENLRKTSFKVAIEDLRPLARGSQCNLAWQGLAGEGDEVRKPEIKTKNGSILKQR